MLSIDLIRREPDLVTAALARRGEESSIPELLEQDLSRRTLVTKRDVSLASRPRGSR